MFNVTVRCFHLFDCSQIVTIWFNILVSHVLVFITVCIQIISCYFFHY